MSNDIRVYNSYLIWDEWKGIPVWVVVADNRTDAMQTFRNNILGKFYENADNIHEEGEDYSISEIYVWKSKYSSSGFEPLDLLT